MLLGCGCSTIFLTRILEVFLLSPPNAISRLLSPAKSDPEIKLGIATHWRCRPFGIVDGDGSYIEPNYIIACLAGLSGAGQGDERRCGKGVSPPPILRDAVAVKHGIEVHETPVGFKYIGELISQNRIQAVRESAVFYQGHVPEKDGILACFLVAEMVACETEAPGNSSNVCTPKWGVLLQDAKT